MKRSKFESVSMRHPDEDRAQHGEVNQHYIGIIGKFAGRNDIQWVTRNVEDEIVGRKRIDGCDSNEVASALVRLLNTGKLSDDLTLSQERSTLRHFRAIVDGVSETALREDEYSTPATVTDIAQYRAAS